MRKKINDLYKKDYNISSLFYIFEAERNYLFKNRFINWLV